MSSKLTIGLDVGTLTTKIILSSHPDQYELVRTSHGSHSLPTAVSFSSGRARMIGEDSVEKGDANTVCMLDRLLDGTCGDDDIFLPFQRFAYSREKDAVVIPAVANGEYSSTALMTMLLGRILRNVRSTAERLGDKNAKDAEVEFVFGVPPAYPVEARRALLDASYAVGVLNSTCVDSTLALGKVLQTRKFGDGETNVMIVEMGHARTSISVLKLVGANAEMEVEEKKDSNDGTIEILANVSSSSLGAGSIDICLYHHFLSTHPSLAGSSFDTKSRSAQRLLDGCKKLKHLLSMLSEGSVTVESIGKNESDVTLTASRDLLTKLCQDSFAKPFKSMMEQCIDKAGGMEVLDNIASVELTGGGSRIPLVQEMVLECLGKKENGDFAFSKSLDDTALALGSAMMGTLSNIPDDDALTAMSDERQAHRNTLRENENAMAQVDAQLIQKDELKNQIESHILELRSARHGKHGSLLPISEEFNSFLNETDDYLFSEECDEASLDTMTEKWQEIKSKSEELCADYFNAKKLEAERIDREMEAEAKRAAAEAALDGDDGDADHDTRKLPTKRRMEIVLKNKQEATELFTDGNIKFAAARYAKALTHCGKFFDLSPEDEKEVKNIKLNLHSNMALCYIKLEKYDNAFQSCNEALTLDPVNVKALFRRASVHHHRRKFDLALDDLKKAETLAPDDKAVKKLKRLVDHEVLKQKKKEQAMAKKMFG